MADQPKTERGQRVYNRPAGGAKGPGGGGRASRVMAEALAAGGALWRALVPLLVGFVLLLALIVGLGVLSISKLEEISSDTSADERRLANASNTLLNLRLAINRLNTEARLRGRVEAGTESVLRPPTDIPLRRERVEVERLLALFDALVLADPERKRAVHDEIVAFIEATKDAETYSAQGFRLNREVGQKLEVLLDEAVQQRLRVEQQRNDELRVAGDEIRFLMRLATLTGLVVAAATFFEVWRRFRQMRQADEALGRERQFSAQMLGGMPSAVAAIDRDGHIRSANAAFFEVFPGVSVGASIHDDFASPEGQKLLAAATATGVARTTYRGRWSLPDSAEGQPRAFDVYSSPLEIEGERGLLLTLVDVTEAAETERELRRQESLAAVGKAAAQVAHEIKNPLGSIRLGVALLRDMARERDAQTTIDLVERGINHLSKITLDVTQFSRGRELVFSESELHVLLNESLDLVADKIREKRTRIERRYADDHIEGHWDEDQLRQVFVNLIANAVDASPPEAPLDIVTERTRIAPLDSRRGNGIGAEAFEGVRITVADRGPGMDEQTRARIFEPFFTTKKKGTGLGLAIARQIVEQHGGAIRVESAPGQGTRFIVELPLSPEEA
jgi:signal transduction histidine kinase